MNRELIGVYRAVGGAIHAAPYYSMERIKHIDPTTGVEIMQLTSFPVLSHTLYNHCPCITPDSNTLIYLTYHGPGRGSSPSVWRVNLDGEDIRPVLEREWLAGFVLSPDGKTVYAQDGGTLLAASMEGDEMREIGHIDGVKYAATVLGSVTGDGAWYVSSAVMDTGEVALVRYATDGSEAAVIMTHEFLTHVQVEPGPERRILFGAPADGDGYGLWVTDIDGSNPRTLKMKGSTGHFSWFGMTGDLISTVNTPFGSIATIGENDTEPQILALGGHFWHAAGTLDGRWVVSDTNWPDMGLILLNTETRLWAPLCASGSAHGHPQWTHPHPIFSPDGQYVVYNSDRTGIGQVYAARVPDDIRAQIS